MENIHTEWDNEANLEKSKLVFYWYEKQYDAVAAVLRNMFEASVELGLLDYFARSNYDYYKNSSKESFIMKWNLCENNIRLVFCIERDNYTGVWSLFTTPKYGKYSEGGSFLYYTYAKIDDVVHEALGYIKEAIEYGNSK